MAPLEPYGTTPLPTSSSGSPVQVWFDAESVLDAAQQPQTQQMAVFEATPNDCLNGSVLDVNQHFVVYAVKNGLIRVLHRHSTLRALLRGHDGQRVTDIQFFQDGDVLATAATGETQSSVIIWRVFERSPEIMSETLLEIKTTHFSIRRILWHPFNPNQFWMIHTTNKTNATQVATLVETTRITTTPHETEKHAVCQFHDDYVIMEGAVQLSSNLTDMCWSGRDTRHVLTTHSSGEIHLWDLKKLKTNNDFTVTPEHLVSIREDSNWSRCLFLPHEQAASVEINENHETAWTPCFVTASDNNSTFTLWSPFTSSNKKPTKLQVVALEHPATSYVMDVCYGPAPVDASPPSSFVILADRTAGKIMAFHCRANWSSSQKAVLVGCDYVVPFQTKCPTYSWSVVCAPTTDISEEDLSEQGGLIFDIKLFAYQSTVVQCLTLTSYMCLPPETTWTDPTPGVRLERLLLVHSAHVSEIGSDEDVQYDEDYSLEEEDDEDYEAPDPSSLPPPDGISKDGPAPLGNNPFANWLGAIAAKTTTVAPPTETPKTTESPAAVPAAPPASALPTPDTVPPHGSREASPQTFLSPMDFLTGKGEPKKEGTRNLTPVTGNKKTDTKKEGKKGGKANKPPPAQTPEAKISILKREEKTPPAASAPAAAVSIDAASLSHEIRTAVRDEMLVLIQPSIKQAIQESLNVSVINPIQASIGHLAKEGVKVDNDKIASAVADSVDESLRAAFAESVRNVMIPTLESVTGQVFSQISDKLEDGSLESSSKSSKELEAITTQLATLAELVTTLTQEVQSLKSHVETEKLVPTAVSSPPGVNPMEAARAEIVTLMNERKYEAAFTKAVSTTTTDMALFCCSRAELNDVLGGSKPELSQPILLCLMQQLGTVLVSPQGTNLQLVLDWLQEIAYSLDPTDERIKNHVPAVLQQLVASINTRMASGDEALRRPLQRLLQIVRGMQMG